MRGMELLARCIEMDQKRLSDLEQERKAGIIVFVSLYFLQRRCLHFDVVLINSNAVATEINHWLN